MVIYVLLLLRSLLSILFILIPSYGGTNNFDLPVEQKKYITPTRRGCLYFGCDPYEAIPIPTLLIIIFVVIVAFVFFRLDEGFLVDCT